MKVLFYKNKGIMKGIRLYSLKRPYKRCVFVGYHKNIAIWRKSSYNTKKKVT